MNGTADGRLGDVGRTTTIISAMFVCFGSAFGVAIWLVWRKGGAS